MKTAPKCDPVQAPEIMAGLRNLVISLFRMEKEPNIAAALRRYATRPSLSLSLVGAITK